MRTESVETVGVVTTILEGWVDNTVVSPAAGLLTEHPESTATTEPAVNKAPLRRRIDRSVLVMDPANPRNRR
jgi:hypothetical protein